MDRSPLIGRFRLYSLTGLLAALITVLIVADAVKAAGWGLAGYGAVAAALWVADKVLLADNHSEHVVAHDLLVAAIALVWPLTLLGILAYLCAGAVDAARE